MSDLNRRKFLGALGALSALGVSGAATAQRATDRSSREYRRIGTEAAWMSEAQFDAYRYIARSSWSGSDIDFIRILTGDSEYSRRMVPLLSDVGSGRVEVMDREGVAMQVLCLTAPGVQIFEPATATAIAADSNDQLAEAVRRYPDRFAGLAAFAPQDPEAAAKEMERAVTRLGLSGFIVNSHTNGEYLDQEKFWPILEAAESLDRPIYIHPRSLPEAALGPFDAYGLSGAAWGFAVEAGTHGMRLLLSGVFDRFPKLQIVLGHMGEGIPYWLYRFDHMYLKARRNWGGETMQLKPSEYVKRNFMITTSGMFDELVLKYCLEALGPDSIMWAADYPYQSNVEAGEFLDNADIAERDRVQIYSQNAERVFQLPST